MADPHQTPDQKPDQTPDQASKQTPEQIEAEIAETRAELADTVHALGEKADVSGRAKRRADEVRRDHGTEIAVGGAVVAALVVALVVWRRRR